ncbi:hypothetical protein DSM104443_03982 [Usitatibacter rugosus]|uniref:Uncharacterized protein n=1 Tax=Usitatibacter rugosus TaxID=2732067 RepID=A0A6M4H166_9PROT|nr:DNA phosphorothioation system sulfurtransferase DndC [Usitatibacter rugosus]QJR12888.1 hypothetical protein DSM104443_03982 [Usitatibacter rugosus]
MRDSKAIAEIQSLYRSSDRRWILGFSGGKDSTAVLKLVFNALLELNRPLEKPVTVVYCDTGVEIPVIRDFVRKTLRNLSREVRDVDLPIETRCVQPRLSDRYFVKVIGRGYPPPTSKFRWCTNRLRIDPVQSVVRAIGGSSSLVLLGVRYGESDARDKAMDKHLVPRTPFLRQAGGTDTLIYSPIRSYSLVDVWDTVSPDAAPRSIDATTLASLYRGTSGECPVVRDQRGAPCGAGRFGCWTCTVVRKDAAMINLVESGTTAMQPLLEFRDWLALMRDDPKNRWSKRRNGAVGLGPLTMAARKLILRRLMLAEEKSGMKLILRSELRAIESLWALERS